MTADVRYLGVGRGPKTRDGCSVELYLRLPYCGEVALFERCIPEAASVMELGCGVGRVTRELLARGYRCFRYREGEDEWLQYFTATILDDEDIHQSLSSAGFEPPEWINRRWACARVVSSTLAEK